MCLVEGNCKQVLGMASKFEIFLIQITAGYKNRL